MEETNKTQEINKASRDEQRRQQHTHIHTQDDTLNMLNTLNTLKGVNTLNMFKGVSRVKGVNKRVRVKECKGFRQTA